nr:uncharacterized protein LOC128675197 [Plodia interpunctella]
MRFILIMILLINLNLQVLPYNMRVNRTSRGICNAAIFDKVLIKRATLVSKYIFTGKVSSVKTENDTSVYKVNIRRVLKGDLNEIGVVVKFGRAKSLRFSDATVLVASSRTMTCPPMRVRTYAIFLTEKSREETYLLRMVVAPVLLTLKNIDIIEAALKGMCRFVVSI